MKNVTMDNPLTTQEIYDELFNFKESLKKLADDFGELANGIMLSLAKQDRPEGEWEHTKVIWGEEAKAVEEWQSARCSNCGRYHTTPYRYYFNDYDFCPNCGADMRGEDE